MKKLYIVITFLLLFICTKVYAFDFSVESKKIILYNMNDNNVIYEEKSEEKSSIASLTKIMTAIVAIENIEDLNEKVTITSKDLYDLVGYSKAGFKVGDVVTYEDLLYGLMLPSGGDAAQVLSNNIDSFIDKMNGKSSDIGMNDTKFSNVLGKDNDNNYSTAKDISKLLIYALKNETFKKIFNSNEYTTSNGLELEKTTHKLARLYNVDINSITGSKTGFTGEAGYCLASTATINGIDYLMVTLGADDIGYHIIDSEKIYKYYGDNYSYIEILSKGQKLKTLKIKFGKNKTYDVLSDKKIEKYLKNDIDKEKIKYEYKGIEELNYKIKKGDKLGKVTIKYENKVLDTYDVYLNDDISYIIHWFIIIPVGVILIIFTLFKLKKRKYV